MRAQRGIRRIPIHRIREVDVEIRNHRLSLHGHVRRRRKISLLNILQQTHQRLLRSASRARVPLNRSLIDHNRKREPRMRFRFRHHQPRSLINRIIRPVPINDDAINAAADHIRNLAVNLRRIVRVVANAHVVRPPEPQHHVSVDFRRSSRIQQRVHVDLAYVSRAAVAVRLARESVSRTCVIRSLSGESCGGDNIRRASQTHH